MFEMVDVASKLGDNTTHRCSFVGAWSTVMKAARLRRFYPQSCESMTFGACLLFFLTRLQH